MKNTKVENPHIDGCVRASLATYFETLQGIEPSGVYEMMIMAVEKPLLEEVMKYSHNNQSVAANILGIGRSTLRKKLMTHNLL